jgi:hypothetical protein
MFRPNREARVAGDDDLIDPHMSDDTGLRIRLERLLRGDVREQDIHQLFFNMRDETGGSRVVAEVTHFLAHPQKRNRGTAMREVRDLFGILRLLFWLERLESQNLILPVMPATVPDALRGNFRRMRPSMFKAARIKRTRAEEVLERILARMTPTGFGGLRKPIIKDPEEYMVFMMVGRVVKGGSLFTEDDLFKDFAGILRTQALLKPKEVRALENAKPAITLFAVNAMHNRIIDLGDGTTATLQITPDMNGNLGVFAYGQVADRHPTDDHPTTAAAWLLETSLSIGRYCEPGTARNGRLPFEGNFEMTPNGKLARLR